MNSSYSCCCVDNAFGIRKICYHNTLQNGICQANHQDNTAILPFVGQTVSAIPWAITASAVVKGHEEFPTWFEEQETWTNQGWNVKNPCRAWTKEILKDSTIYGGDVQGHSFTNYGSVWLTLDTYSISYLNLKFRYVYAIHSACGFTFWLSVTAVWTGIILCDLFYLAHRPLYTKGVCECLNFDNFLCSCEMHDFCMVHCASCHMHGCLIHWILQNMDTDADYSTSIHGIGERGLGVCALP